MATTEDDGALMAMDLLQMAGSDFADYLKKSSHYQRLSHLHHYEDMVYCLKQSTIDVVVGLKDEVLVKFL
jgi:phosphosulfolactate phosphohydrolase-like enzyme